MENWLAYVKQQIIYYQSIVFIYNIITNFENILIHYIITYLVSISINFYMRELSESFDKLLFYEH